MTNAPGGRGPHPETDSFFDSLRRVDLRRAPGGWIGGVGSGIAARVGLDPIVIRAVFVLLALFFGIGLPVYLIAWLLIPDEQDATHLERALRHGEGASIVLLVVAALTTVGALPWWDSGPAFGPSWGWGWGWIWWLSSLVVLALIGWWLWTAWQGRERPGQFAQGRPDADPPPPPPGHAYGAAGASPGYAPAASAPAGPYAASAAGTPPSPPSRPLRPVQESRRTGGALVGLIATGLVLLAVGGLYWAGAEFGWPGNHLVVALAGGLALLGLIVLALGASGRHSGWPGFLATLLLLATVVLSPVPEDFQVSGRFGQDTWRPTTLDPGAEYRLGAGEGLLDLRGLDPAELDGQDLSADVGAGQLTVLIPEDLTVQVIARSGLGTVSFDPSDFGQPGSTHAVGGFGISEQMTVGDGPVDLILDAQVGIGQVTLERNGR